MTQMLLPFNHIRTYKEIDFCISECNRLAYKIVNDDENWCNNRLILLGEVGSGKSHLAHIWQQKSHGIFMNMNVLNDDFVNINTHIVIENIDKLGEELGCNLFYILNLAKERNIKVLMTACEFPTFSLPDLQSRLNASSITKILKPDEEIIKNLIVKQLTDRQISIKKEVLNYITSHTKHSFFAIQQLILTLDQTSLRELRPITIPLVKKIMR